MSPSVSIKNLKTKGKVIHKYDPNTKIDEIIVQHYEKKELYH